MCSLKSGSEKDPTLTLLQSAINKHCALAIGLLLTRANLGAKNIICIAQRFPQSFGVKGDARTNAFPRIQLLSPLYTGLG